MPSKLKTPYFVICLNSENHSWYRPIAQFSDSHCGTFGINWSLCLSFNLFKYVCDRPTNDIKDDTETASDPLII